MDSSDDITYNIVGPPPCSSPDYRFLERCSSKPLIAEVNKLSADVLNSYSGDNKTVSKYKKLKRFSLSGNNKRGNYNVIISLDAISEFIRERRTFTPNAFGLPPLPNNWLDGGVKLAVSDGPIISSDNSRYLPFELPPHFSKESPIVPCLDREGMVFSSFQQELYKNIVHLHSKVIDNCDKAFDSDSLDWFHDLRFLINECVTIVEMTLNQLYLRAEFSSSLPPDWTFDKAALGSRYGRRMMDKFCWIFKITGSHLECADQEKRNFRFLKDLRNHLSHFDPPCFCFTMEDVVAWMNKVSDVGRLLFKMRTAMKLHCNVGIIEIITLPLVKFAPKITHVPRLPMTPNVGYASCIWKVT